ncbi:hypothetical protein H6P81_014818 [Aristolochia fimbriata]|uniref:Uncharacterized protein n=1 Tax=Aristolochia fimbriata TaxID=158543 RepID=A0AAV7E894_ARIFI|nr:hypothetical protein H6P81_014818 [Aristolochia fimbriata]
MGRQSGADPTALHYSIALLQERFRQLQRVKEMREERELLRVLAQAEQVGPTRCEAFYHPDLILSCRPHQASLSLRPEVQFNCANFQSNDMPMLTSLWPQKSASNTSNTRDDADVDTSLHL